MNFDSNGNLIPYDILKTSYRNLKYHFVECFPLSKTRKTINAGHTQYITDIFNEIIDEWIQWIDGSFTTQKIDPNDVDVLNILEWTDSLNDKAEQFNKFMTLHGSKDLYSVDGYFVFKYNASDERHEYYQDRINYWKELFSQDRSGHPKGFVQLNISDSALIEIL
jgi:hypothetical protein